MFVRLNCVILDADAGNRQELATFLTEHGLTVLSLLSSRDQLPALLRQPDAPHVVIVNLDPGAAESLRGLGALIAQHPRTGFFVMSQQVDPQLLMDAIHLRVTEFIPLPMSPERLLAGLDKFARTVQTAQRAKVINVVPTIGGCGATSIACNIAAALAPSHKTVIVDLDLICGSVASAFDLTPRYTIADVMNSGGTLDKHLLDNALAVHPRTGLSVLARPEQPEASLKVTRDNFMRLMNLLAQGFDYVIVDSQISLDPLYMAAIQSADTNVLVMELNVPSARNAERFVGALRRSAVKEEAIQVIVNRCERRNGDISVADVESALGLRVTWKIPNDFKNAMAAINFGEPVVLRAPRAEMSGSLTGLVRLLDGRPPTKVVS